MFTSDAAVEVARGIMKKVGESRGAQQVVVEHNPIQGTKGETLDSHSSHKAPSVDRMEGESDFLYTLRSVAAAVGSQSSFTELNVNKSQLSVDDDKSHEGQYNPSYESAIDRQVLLYFTNLQVDMHRGSEEGEKTNYELTADSFEIESEMEIGQVELLQKAVALSSDRTPLEEASVPIFITWGAWWT